MSGVSVAKKNGGQTSAIFANDTRWQPNSQILHRRDRSNSRVTETARPSGVPPSAARPSGVLWTPLERPRFDKRCGRMNADFKDIGQPTTCTTWRHRCLKSIGSPCSSCWPAVETLKQCGELNMHGNWQIADSQRSEDQREHMGHWEKMQYTHRLNIKGKNNGIRVNVCLHRSSLFKFHQFPHCRSRTRSRTSRKSVI